jgi:hypothetical protein
VTVAYPWSVRPGPGIGPKCFCSRKVTPDSHGRASRVPLLNHPRFISDRSLSHPEANDDTAWRHSGPTAASLALNYGATTEPLRRHYGDTGIGVSVKSRARRDGSSVSDVPSPPELGRSAGYLRSSALQAIGRNRRLCSGWEHPDGTDPFGLKASPQTAPDSSPNANCGSRLSFGVQSLAKGTRPP